MKTIVVGVSYPRKFKFGAAAISWWEDSEKIFGEPVSHAYSYIKRSTGKKMVYHAIGSGTQFWGYETFIKINKPVVEIEVDIEDDIFDTVVDKLIDRLHTSYSKKHLFGLFIKRFLQYVFKMKSKNLFKDKDKSEVCVETLCMIIDAAKIIELAEDPEDMGIYEAGLMLKKINGRVITGKWS